MKHNFFAKYLLVLCLGVAATNARAQGEPGEDLSGETGDAGGVGSFTIDLGWASAYVFRGLNIFAGDNHRDTHNMIAPGLEWDIADTGLVFGYWSAYQLNGSNRGALIDGGVGAEQDLYLSYSFNMLDILSARGALYYYFYPAADEEDAGEEVPMYIEPQLGMTISFYLDWNMDVAFFRGLQDTTRPASYVYLNPSVSKEFTVLPILGVFGKVGYGFKLWHEDHEGDDNTHDLLFEAGANISLGRVYVSPAIHVTWTNLSDTSYADGTDGVVVWGSVNVGATI